MLLSGSGIPSGTTISTMSGGTITMSANATASGTLVTVFALPNVSRKCITISDTAIYVGTLNASSKCTTIEQYTLAGAYTKTWTRAFTDVGGLAVDGLGNVYVFDQGDTAVKVFDSAGTFLRSWGTAGAADGQFSASSGYMVHAIAVDELKNVYVADWATVAFKSLIARERSSSSSVSRVIFRDSSKTGRPQWRAHQTDLCWRMIHL
jgi:hypothetical protein